MSYQPSEIRYIHNKKILKLAFPDAEFELEVNALYHQMFNKPLADGYIEYIQQGTQEVVFGFSDHKSYSIAFDTLFKLAKTMQQGLQASGNI